MITLQTKPAPKTPICEGLITDKTMLFLRRMFSDPEKYCYYMNTLVAMRKLMVENMSYDGVIDRNNELYPILDTINEFINALEGGRNREITRINGLML